MGQQACDLLRCYREIGNIGWGTVGTCVLN